MGIVNKEELEWYNVSLSDPDSVKGLLKLRNHFDLLFDMSDVNLFSTNVDIADQLEEVTCTYAWLDKVMSKVNFTEQQQSILDRYIEGYSVEEIAEEDEQTVRNINGILNKICKSISQEAERQWRIWAYTHKLELKTKKCSRCGEELPATEEFFRPRNDSVDGFRKECRKCETEMKKK